MPFLAIGKSSEFKPMALQDSRDSVNIILSRANGCQAQWDVVKLIFPQGARKLGVGHKYVTHTSATNGDACMHIYEC